MVEKKLVALVLICVVLSVGVVGAVMVLDQKEAELQLKNNRVAGLESEKVALETQVATLQVNVSGLQSEIVTLSNEKAALESQVSSLQTGAATLESEKSALEMQVSTLQADISSLQAEIASLINEKGALEVQVSSLQAEIVSLEGEVVASFDLGFAEGEAEGYQVGYEEGYVQGVEDGAGSGWYIRDPTYAEAIAFISLDETDKNDWGEDYVCYDFTADFAGNAFQMGYRCGFVYIEFTSTAHAIACFNTTDGGLIYVEPQTDEIVDVAVGQLYDGQVIVRMGIIW